MSAVTAQPSNSVNGTDWARIFVAYFSLFVLGFLDSSRGPYFPDITTDLGLTDTVASLFYVLASLFSAVSGFVTGYFTRRAGLLNVLRSGHLLMGLGCLGWALAPNFAWLALACVIFGLGFGFINVGQNLLIIEGSSTRLRRQFLSGLHSVYAFASLVAPVLIGILSAQGIGWRQSYRGFFLIAAVGFFFTFFVQKKRKPVTEMPAASSSGVRRHFKIYLLLATLISFYICGEILVASRMVLLLRRDYGITEALAPQFLAGFFCLMLLGRLTFTFLPFQNLSNRQIMLVCLSLAAVLVTLGLLHSPIWLVVSGLAMAPVFGISVDYMAQVFPRSSVDVISWVLAMSGFFIVFMHFFVGYLTEKFGIHFAMFLGPVLFLFSFCLLLAAPKEALEKS